jgi:integrase
MAPKKRRQYGTGSVYQRASDGRWIGAAVAGWTAKGTSRRITVSCSAEEGAAECKRRLKKKVAEIALNGAPAVGVSSRATVKSWAQTWMPTTKTRLRPKSWQTSRSAVNAWIIPTIGQRRLDELNPGDIRAVTNAARKAGRSSSTALRIQVVLTQMLRDAVIEGHQVPPRVLMLAKPAAAASDRDAIATPDALVLLKVATGQESGSRWVAALLQGMRQGECLGLTWDAVDFESGLIDVSWQLQALPYISGRSGPFRVPDGYEYRKLDGALCLVRPKTEKGRRIIPMVPWMATALHTWRNLSPESPHGLVWPRAEGRPETSSADRAAWYALQVTAKVQHPSGRRYQLHEARHTTATLLLEAGVDPEVIKAILGHSSIVTSRGYQHVSQTLTRNAMNELAERLQLSA